MGDPVYEKKMFIFCVSLRAGNTVPKTKWEKNEQNFWGLGLHPDPPTVLEQTKIVGRPLALLRFFSISNILPIIDQCRLFYFWYRPWYSDEYA